jgi:pimeloyl-ACP methyl ester carboxylesterase
MIRYFVARGETLKLNSTTRAGLRGSFIALSDGVTHYELSGPENGELVLLLPGITVPLFYWDKMVTRLNASGYRTLAYSAYGRGYSDRAVARYDEAFFVRQTRELIEKLRLGQVSHMFGTSLGALTAMWLLQEPWFKTKTTTLVGPAGLERKLPLMARLAQGGGSLVGVLGRYFGHNGVTAHLDRNVRLPEHCVELKDLLSGPLAYEGTIYSIFSTLAAYPLTSQQHLYEKTGALKVPTLLIWGDEDLVTPTEAVGEARTLLKPQQWHIIQNCGHMAPFEKPDEVAELFKKFVAAL